MAMAALRPSNVSAGQRSRSFSFSPRPTYLAIAESSTLRLACHQIQSSGYGLYDGLMSQYAQVGKYPWLSLQYIRMPLQSCLMLLRQAARLAAARDLASTGNSTPISTAMMPMTTSSSTRVKPRGRRERIVACVGVMAGLMIIPRGVFDSAANPPNNQGGR